MKTPLMLDDDVTKVPCPSCERSLSLDDVASFFDEIETTSLDCVLCWSTGLVFPEERAEWLRKNPKEKKHAQRGQ